MVVCLKLLQMPRGILKNKYFNKTLATVDDIEKDIKKGD